MQPNECIMAGSCYVYGEHAESCTDRARCRGCRPRETFGGLKLCATHMDGIALDAARAAENHAELAYRLAKYRSAVSGDVVSGTRERDLVPDDRIVEARSEIMNVLTYWCSVAMQRFDSLTLARLDSVTDMALFIARTAVKMALASEDDARDVVNELHELAWGEPWRVAYPQGTRIIPLRRCPYCVGEIRAVLRQPGSLQPAEIQCAYDERHRWQPHEWLGVWPTQLNVAGSITTDEAAAALGVSSDSVRQYVTRGRLARVDDGRISTSSVWALYRHLWSE